MKTHLVQLNSKGDVKYITFILDKNTLSREWGVIGGHTQYKKPVEYAGKNIGKKNEQSPAMVATADKNRIIKKKIKEGYQTIDSLENINMNIFESEVLDFETIPTNFCCSKPIAKSNEKKINENINNKNLRFFHKYNGLCHYILCTPTGDIKIYTRRLDDHTAKYPDKVKEIKESGILVPCSIAITEFTIDPRMNLPHMESFRRMSQISKSNTFKGGLEKDQSKSFEYQKESPVKAALFAMLYFNGKNVGETLSYDDNFDRYISELPKSDSDSFIFQPDEYKFKSLKAAEEYLKLDDIEYMIEGFVAWIMTEKLDISMSGKPKRRACFKVKIPKDDDLIAYDYIEGKIKGQVGSLLIGKLNKNKEIVPLSKVGSGLKGLDLFPAYWNFPEVVAIKYANRFPSGDYQFPVFDKRHEDKIIEDCVLDESGM